MGEELRSHIERYLIDLASLRDLEAWLLSNLQGILDSGDEAAIAEADEVEADLIELGEGLIDEVTFRERLESRVRLKETVALDFLPRKGPPTVHTEAAVATVINRLRLEVPASVVTLHRRFGFG